MIASTPLFQMLRALTASVLAGSLGAQALVLPPTTDAIEGNAAESWLAGPFTARRQLILDAAWLHALAGRDLSALSVRRNQGSAEVMDAGALHVELRFAPAAVAPADARSDFAANRQTPGTLVFAGRVEFPAAPPAPATPAPWLAPFAVTIPFSVPFRYQTGPLVIETMTRPLGSAANPWWSLDAVVGATTGEVAGVGRSCLTGVHDPSAGAELRTMVVGASASLWLRGMAAPTPAFCLLGGDDRSFQGVPLPLDLTVAGLPGCTLYNDIVAMVPALSTPWRGGRGGLAMVTVPLPADPNLAGAVLFSQWLVPPIGNGGSIELSNGVRATIGIRPPEPGAAWVESVGVAPTVPRVLHDRCPVVRLHYTP